VTSNQPDRGVLYGVGIGPGDPELLTLKALKLIQKADVIAFLQNTRGYSLAFSIVEQFINENQQLYPLILNCDRDRRQAKKVYEQAAEELQEFLSEGKIVAVLCEGDPFFYGSFIYIYDHLAADWPCTVIPGVNSISAVASQAGSPIVRLDQSLKVITGPSDEETIKAALIENDAVVIMKVGHRLKNLIAIIADCGRIQDAVYVEKATTGEQFVCTDVSELSDHAGIYFSMLLVTGKLFQDREPAAEKRILVQSSK